MITECGCLVLPQAIAVFDPMEAECHVHGWQAVTRKATPRETINTAVGLPLDFTVEYPDEPPF